MKRKTTVRIALVLFLLVAAGAAGFLYYRYETSPARVAERILRAIPGVDTDGVVELMPGRLGVQRLFFRVGEKEFAFCEGAEIAYGENGSVLALSTESLTLTDLSKLPVFLNSASVFDLVPPELTVSGFLAGDSDKSEPLEVRFQLKQGKEKKYDLIFSFPQHNLTVTGQYNAGTRLIELHLQGRVTPELLAQLNARIPAELELSGPFDAEARLEVSLAPGKEPAIACSGDLTFPAGTVLSGGAWSFSPGARASFRWNGEKRPWEVVLPETMLLEPLELPLGTLAVSGGADSTLRFSVVNTPPAGELTGVMRIDGHYDRANGNWMFRQAESADRAVRWRGALPFGEFGCVWREPRISGGGTRSRGGIEFSLGFESLQWRSPGNPRELTALPGTLTGSWQFDNSSPESSSFEFSGLIRSSKIDWPEPESAWSASGALVAFRYSRLPGEKEAALTVEPEFGGVNLYGSAVPKMKMEGVTGKFHTGFDPAAGVVFPLRVEGGIEMRRVNPVYSIFGSGEFRALHFSGFAGFDASGALQALQTTGGAEEALFRYPECEIISARPEIDLEFDRNAVTPGENFLGQIRSRKLTLAAFGGRFVIPGGKALWRGELRETGLFPETWHVAYELPAGTVSGGEFDGAFRSLNGSAVFERTRLTRFGAEMSGFSARLGSAAISRRLTAEKQTLNVIADATGRSGRYLVENGSIQIDGYAAREVTVDLPVVWTESGMAGRGTLRAAEVDSPDGILQSVTSSLQLANGELKLAGTAASPQWEDGALTFDGRVFRENRWRMTGAFRLSPVELASPLKLNEVVPVFSGMSLAGNISGNGSFEVLSEKVAWNCEFKPDGATFSGNGLALKNITGTVRLEKNREKPGNPGGELQFASATGGPVEMRNGSLAFRLPRPGECDVLSASGHIWKGRARLAAPFSITSGSAPTEVGVNVRGLDLQKLLEAFAFAPGLVDGQADGTLYWNLFTDGRPPVLISADLTAHGARQLKLQALESYITSSSGPEQKLLFELLRDFKCSALRLKAEEEEAGIRLELSGSGRPSKAGYRRVTRSVDPALFGLDEEIDFTVNYRIPYRKEAKDTK